jgi:hypothetical protein
LPSIAQGIQQFNPQAMGKKLVFAKDERVPVVALYNLVHYRNSLIGLLIVNPVSPSAS